MCIVHVEVLLISTTEVLVDFTAVIFLSPAPAHAGHVRVEVSRETAIHATLQEWRADVCRLEKLLSALVQLCGEEKRQNGFKTTRSLIFTGNCTQCFHKGSGTFWRSSGTLVKTLFTAYCEDQSHDRMHLIPQCLWSSCFHEGFRNYYFTVHMYTLNNDPKGSWIF